MYFRGFADKIHKTFPKKSNSNSLEKMTTASELKVLNPSLKTSKDLFKERAKPPSFQQFVQYILYQHRNNEVLNEHWTPMYKFCSMCLFDFDIIAKVSELSDVQLIS